MEQNFEQIAHPMSRLRVALVPDEYTLQRDIQTVLDQNRISYQKECLLAPRNRVDFLVEGGIAIEVKCGRQKPNLTRVLAQLHRYAASEQVCALLLLVERNLVGVPKQIEGKPCKVLGLHRLWGVAL